MDIIYPFFLVTGKVQSLADYFLFELWFAAVKINKFNPWLRCFQRITIEECFCLFKSFGRHAVQSKYIYFTSLKLGVCNGLVGDQLMNNSFYCRLASVIFRIPFIYHMTACHTFCKLIGPCAYGFHIKGSCIDIRYFRKNVMGYDVHFLPCPCKRYKRFCQAYFHVVIVNYLKIRDKIKSRSGSKIYRRFQVWEL